MIYSVLKNKQLRYLIISIFLANSFISYSQSDYSTEKPWTYWWWMGSAVDSFNIERNLEMMKQSGLGGAHIIPIYGVKGEEENYIEYLSPEWQVMLEFTSRKASECGLGIDMTLGTGWCFGGKTVDERNGCMAVQTESIPVVRDTAIELSQKNSYPLNKVVNVLVVYEDGRRRVINDSVYEGNFLNWHGNNKAIIHITRMEGPVYKVKRAAPGGEGYMLDPFSANSFLEYSLSFDTAFDGRLNKYLRSIYHDSYEYYGANWTKNFFKRFQFSRGYDLRFYIPELYGKGDVSINKRILADYRQTIAELHLKYVKEIQNWAEKNGLNFRNQSHGAPANLLDVYAAAGIPETETFGATNFSISGLSREEEFIREEEPNPFIMKFASSAAHVTGKRLVSSETHTWLREHFRIALSHCKPEIDQLFISGINHIFYHGTTYSPIEADWPGWLFYAETNFAPSNSIYQHFPALNKYVKNCQEILQMGKPDNEILVYFPVQDIWHNGSNNNLLQQLSVHNYEEWLLPTGFYRIVSLLDSISVSFDFISDKQLLHSGNDGTGLTTGGKSYKVLVIPPAEFIPLATLKKICLLAEQGVKIIFQEKLPGALSGYQESRTKTEEFEVLINDLQSRKRENIQILTGKNFLPILDDWGIKIEEIGLKGLNYLRSEINNGFSYFISNLHTGTDFSSFIPVEVEADHYELYDPMTGKRGLAITKMENGKRYVKLELKQGASVFLNTLDGDSQNPDAWNYFDEPGDTLIISGEWNLDFVAGGPEIPDNMTIDTLISWTELERPEVRCFSGLANYRTGFTIFPKNGSRYKIAFDTVKESVKIILNGNELPVLFAFPFELDVTDYLKEGRNNLILEVVNLPANRIKNLDEEGVKWQIFHDINYVNIHYKPFSTEEWDFVPSGIIGRVMLIEFK